MSGNTTESTGRNWRIPEWFPELSKETLSQLRAYHSELIFFNGRMNLISPRSEANADLIHFADGILGSRVVLQATDAQTIYDIGSGNGIPGLILAILAPERKVILVDADARKIEFLKHVISRVGIKNCSAMHARLEDLPEATIECAITRGFASVSKSLLMARRGASERCEFFHFKGDAWSSEVADVPSQILAYWDITQVRDYRLPAGEIVLTILVSRRKS